MASQRGYAHDSLQHSLRFIAGYPLLGGGLAQFDLGPGRMDGALDGTPAASDVLFRPAPNRPESLWAYQSDDGRRLAYPVLGAPLWNSAGGDGTCLIWLRYNAANLNAARPFAYRESASNGLNIGCESGTTARANFYFEQSNIQTRLRTSANVLTRDTWHCIALSFGPAGVVLRVDGVAPAMISTTSAVQAITDDTIYIGTSNAGSNPHFRGDIGPVYFWERELSEAEHRLLAIDMLAPVRESRRVVMVVGGGFTPVTNSIGSIHEARGFLAPVLVAAFESAGPIAEQIGATLESLSAATKPITTTIESLSAATQSVVSPVEARGFLAPVLVAAFESARPIAQQAGATFESLSAVTQPATAILEALLSVLAIQLSPYEALGAGIAVSAARSIPFETMLALAPVLQGPLEALANAQRILSPSLEGLAHIDKIANNVYESIENIVALSIGHQEALGRIVRIFANPYESTLAVSQGYATPLEGLALALATQAIVYEATADLLQSVSTIPFESAGVLAVDGGLTLESLARTQRTIQAPIESLLGIPGTRGVGFEAIATLSSLLRSPMESAGRLAIARIVGVESLAAIRTISLASQESLASAIRTAAAQYEALGSSLVSTSSVPLEAIGRLSVLQTSSLESLLTVAQGQGVPLESLALAVQVLRAVYETAGTPISTEIVRLIIQSVTAGVLRIDAIN